MQIYFEHIFYKIYELAEENSKGFSCIGILHFRKLRNQKLNKTCMKFFLNVQIYGYK